MNCKTYQENFTKSVDDSEYASTVEREERYANIFASFLLLPEAGLKMLAPVEERRKDRISLGTILKLEQHFSCSRMTLLLRLKEIGWISEDYLCKYNENVKRSAAEYGYNTSLYEPTKNTEICGDYNIKARSLFDKALISRSKFRCHLAFYVNGEDRCAAENSPSASSLHRCRCLPRIHSSPAF